MTPAEWFAEMVRVEAGMRALLLRRGWDITPGYDPDADDEEEEDVA